MAFYRLDQEINDRGVLVDRELVEQSITCDLLHKDIVTNRAYEVTGLENPNSVSQLKGWLSERGVEIDSLSKGAVAELIEDADGEVLEALKLRLLMAKTSVKKYEGQCVRTEGYMDCCSFMGQIVPAGGQEDWCRYRTFHRIISATWN